MAGTLAVIAPPMETYSRPLVYKHFLLNNYQEELGNIDQDFSKSMVPIIDHDHQVPRCFIPLFNDDGPWEIKKVLTESDVNDLCRLLLPRGVVEKYIFSYWRRMDSERVKRLEEDGCSVKVSVRVFGTLMDHELVFMKWKSNNSYVFKGGWSKFARALKLEAGDEIGMFWNSDSKFFVFRLLKKNLNNLTVS